MKKLISTLMAGSLISAAALSQGCSSNKKNLQVNGPETQGLVMGYADSHTDRTTEENKASYIPRAVIYKTNGDYNDNVFINLDQSRQRIVSFPAVSDITAISAPVKLVDGYLLDRRGITRNSAFLSLTYKEYSELGHTPSPSQLMKLILPGAKVTEIVELPWSTSEAQNNLKSVDSLISNGLPGCRFVLGGTE